MFEVDTQIIAFAIVGRQSAIVDAFGGKKQFAHSVNSMMKTVGREVHRIAKRVTMEQALDRVRSERDEQNREPLTLVGWSNELGLGYTKSKTISQLVRQGTMPDDPMEKIEKRSGYPRPSRWEQAPVVTWTCMQRLARDADLQEQGQFDPAELTRSHFEYVRCGSRRKSLFRSLQQNSEQVLKRFENEMTEAMTRAKAAWYGCTEWDWDIVAKPKPAEYVAWLIAWLPLFLGTRFSETGCPALFETETPPFACP